MGIEEQVAALEAKERLLAPDEWPFMRYAFTGGLYFHMRQFISELTTKDPEMAGLCSFFVYTMEARRLEILSNLKSFCQMVLQDGKVEVAAIERYTKAYAGRVMEHVLMMYPDLRGESIVAAEDLFKGQSGIDFIARPEQIPTSIHQITRENAGLTVALMELYIRNSTTEQ